MRGWKNLLPAKEQREAELRRGVEVAARHALAERFDPDYIVPDGWATEGALCSPAERRRRDEYRKNLPNGRW
jgi:hypothetical protein